MEQANIFHLFVYGSLRSGFQSPAYEYISRYFNLVGEAKVQGALVDLGPYPAAVPLNDDHFIVGELYRIKNENEFSWALGQLDDYEGLNVEYDELPLYRREIVPVFLNDQPPVAAWTYWYNGDVSGKPIIPSGDLRIYLDQKK